MVTVYWDKGMHAYPMYYERGVINHMYLLTTTKSNLRNNAIQ